MLCGVLWGCALAGLELSVEFGEWPGLRHLADAAIGLFGIWCLTGIGWTFLSRLVEPLGRRGLAVAAWLAASILFTLIQLAAIVAPIFERFFGEVGDFPRDAIAVHVLWLNAFYGAIYMIGYVLFARSMRSRRRVSRLQRILTQDAARLSEMNLNAARAQLQPQILIDALATAKTRYRRNPATADHLVERLILFLRAATRLNGLGQASLGNELNLAACYMSLQSALRDPFGDWTVDLASPTPALAFPPRVLVPLIERLGESAARLRLQSGYTSDGYFVQVSATGRRSGRALVKRDFPPLANAKPWTFRTTKIEAGLQWTALAARRVTHPANSSMKEGTSS